MSHDRTGESIDLDSPPPERPRRCTHPDCANGWHGEDAEGRLIPCLFLRPHLAQRNTPEPEPVMSEMAKRAIELEELRDKHRRR